MIKSQITLVTGTFKNPDLIIPTIEGFLNQTYKNFKVFIVDDNSPFDKEIIKKSKSIVESFNDSRLFYIKNDVNIGVPYVYRKWISLVDTKYLYICGAGDILLPSAIELMVSLLEKNPDASMVHGIETKPNGKKDIPLFEKTGLYDAKVYLKSHLNDFGKSKVYNWSQASAVFRTELFNIWNIPVKPFHFWDYYFHCTYLLYSSNIGYVNEYIAIRHNDAKETHIRKLPDFISKVERLYQALEFINEHKTFLISQNHKVYSYSANIKKTLLYYSFRQNLSFSESLFCIEKIINSNFLFVFSLFINLLIITPLGFLFQFFKLLKRKIY